MQTLESHFPKANWELIPDHMRSHVRRYLEDGEEPGDFLTAVLENNLRRAVNSADDTNVNRIQDYVRFLYNYAPSESWGSPDKVSEWIRTGGLNGHDH